MGRIMLLGLVALALPTGALATIVSHSRTADPVEVFDTGTFISGTIRTISMGGGTLNNPFEIQIIGSMNTITVSGSLAGGSCSAVAMCTFNGGAVTVTNPSGAVIFSSALSSGSFQFPSSRNIESFTAVLANGLGDLAISNFTWDTGVGTGTQPIIAGAPSVAVSVVREPGTVGLFGAGLIGLAGVVRRKLRPPAQIQPAA